MFDSSVVKDATWDDIISIVSLRENNGIWIDNKHFVALSDVTLIKTYLKNSGTSVNNTGTVNFRNCSFDGLVLDKIDFNLKFIDCEFEGDVQLETNYVVKFSNCVFKSLAKFKGLGGRFSQIELSNITFYENVTLEDFLLDDSKDIVERGGSNSAFRDVNFHRKLTLNNVFFPMDIIFEGVSLPTNLESDRSTFKRLKGVMEHQHNFIDAAFFHSLELNAYREELNNKKRFEAVEDKVIFGFNWYASKFSLSWALPFFWILFLSIVFYVRAFPPEWNLEGFLVWCEQFDKDMFFQFMNPFSWNSKAFDSVYAIWFLHKIIVVPLVYLLIVAIKRKTKL